LVLPMMSRNSISGRKAFTSWRRIGVLLSQFSSEECANYFVNAGYTSA
jgi:hypothetical protein